MRIYIAAPFFNAAQISIVEQIEVLLSSHYEFYSPRLHSGSKDLSPEKRRDPAAWIPVLDSNINELDKCDLVLAVLQFAMPSGHCLAVATEGSDKLAGYKKLELPDNGVVWECGYAFAKQKPIVGFHTDKHLSEMNLMLSHTCIGFVSGFLNLEDFMYPTACTIEDRFASPRVQALGWQNIELSLKDTAVI